MANLFIIHTPFQLFVAQQIIVQENLKNNIFVVGYVYTNKHFLNIYNVIRIDSLWTETIDFHDVAGWAIVDFYNIIESIQLVKKRFFKINSIVEKFAVKTVYMGDIHNASYQLLSEILYNKRIKSVFFEEGSSHYNNSPRIVGMNKIKQILLSKTLDILLYRNLVGRNYAEDFYFKCREYDTLPIYRRYSIVPFYNNSYDVQLNVKKLISDKLQSLINKEIGSLNTNNLVLFLSEVVIEADYEYDSMLKHETIKSYFTKINGISNVLVKFHPRETDIDRERIINAFTECGITARVIAAEVNVPVEYYFQCIPFGTVYTFFASTMLYNGYIFPKTDFISLLSLYNSIHLSKGGKVIPYIQQVLDSNKMKI